MKKVWFKRIGIVILGVTAVAAPFIPDVYERIIIAIGEVLKSIEPDESGYKKTKEIFKLNANYFSASTKDATAL